MIKNPPKSGNRGISDSLSALATLFLLLLPLQALILGFVSILIYLVMLYLVGVPRKSLF